MPGGVELGNTPSADMPSTGTITLKPFSAAVAEVCSTEVCACVPIATTVLMPLSLSVFSRSLLMNLSGPSGGAPVRQQPA